MYIIKYRKTVILKDEINKVLRFSSHSPSAHPVHSAGAGPVWETLARCAEGRPDWERGHGCVYRDNPGKKWCRLGLGHGRRDVDRF